MSEPIVLEESAVHRGRATLRNDHSLYGPSEVFSPVYEQPYFKRREVVRVDPLSKRKAGPYKLDAMRASLNEIYSRIEYDSKWGTPVHVAKTVSGYCSGWSFPNQALKTQLNWSREMLINNALNGVREEHVSLTQFIAELSSATSLISNSAKKIASSALMVRRGNFRGAARQLGISTPRGVSKSKNFANNYLAYKFGWMPLVADAMGAGAHLATRARAVRIRSSSRISSTEPVSIVQRIPVFNIGGQDEFQFVHALNGSKFAFEQVVCEYRLASAFWDEARRLGFLNPAKLAWEVIPLSFVVDTFLNIGDWLGSLDQGFGLEFVTASYTQGYRTSGKVTSSGDWIRENTSTYKNFSYVDLPRVVDYERYRLERSVLRESDMRFSLQLSSPLSINNAINDTALAVQRLKLK